MIYVRCDLSYFNTGINIFAETRFSRSQKNGMYRIDGYLLFRNEGNAARTTARPYGGMAVYSRIEFIICVLDNHIFYFICKIK